MAGIIDIIGVVSSILGIIQFTQEAFPETKKPGSSVRIAVGLDENGGLRNAGGSVPNVILFNEDGEYLGQSKKNGDVKDGSFSDVTVTQSSRQQATYGLFQAGHEAICVAYTSITWPDGSQYAVTGDWGEACGGSWYYSNVYIHGSGYKPKCMWIGSDGKRPQTGFQVHYPEFRSANSSVPAGKDVKKMCDSKAPFQFFTTPSPKSIDYWILDGKTTAKSTLLFKHDLNNDASQKSRRAASTSSSAMVITNTTHHSVQELCGSETSSGPDLLNLSEKSFCRMSDKKIFPQCDDTVNDNCFNADSRQLIVGGKAARSPYALVWDWQTPGKTFTSKVATSAKIAAREPYAAPQEYNNIVDWSIASTESEPVEST
ncbi:hypothetical protein MCOR25_001242 [Pyricularia grisea]|uniref:Uncharacterized protein n=1 Tax=Pyricularia grisea TaxID=148305 RepID=A0A6P8BGC9_PYRGI|nr:uncharacterized protein PgNI_00752 [Pyricularia grisea]KAI6381308.1 hypothetical protein MCOR25_001242 [Pyricularia grisea]TLD15717.1 hypothetical protein PgNI_00752 [Pyricularia grisea]